MRVKNCLIFFYPIKILQFFDEKEDFWKSKVALINFLSFFRRVHA